MGKAVMSRFRRFTTTRSRYAGLPSIATPIG